jgi:DNA replication and repair protein RecF
MGFEELRFFNFRNLADRELALGGARELFLVGENGQGKTNLIEAVHLLCVGSSFRESRDAALVRDPAVPLGLFGRYANGQASSRTFSLQIAPGRRKDIQLDGKPVAERKELFAEALCICFVQQDMGFVTGTPDARRKLYDQTLILSDLSFLDLLRCYRQVLRSRNLSLRARQDDLLEVYDGQLAGFGLEIQARRKALAEQFNAVFAPLFRDVSGSEQAVEIRYRPSWAGLAEPAEAIERLSASRERDLAFGATTTGPHRDVFWYALAGRDFTRLASTGQLRLCALVLRVAQARFLSERTGRRPVLLLDDVLLELDPGRKRAFVSRFPAYEQAFFTFLPDESWQSFRGPDTLVMTVERGDFRA